MQDPDTLSTGEVARLCGVTSRTVAGWIDAGLLPAWRVPPSRRFRRVRRADLERSGFLSRRHARE